MELQGDWGLKRLFRPSVETLPVSEQLQYYHQRDFLPSHLYRLGLNLFGKDSGRIRKRVINAPPATIPIQNSTKTNNHPVNIVKTRKNALKRTPVDDTVKKLPLLQLHQDTISLNDDHATDTDEYLSKWVTDRQALRNNLETFGDCEQWLKAKQCTPLESSVLEQIRAKKNSTKLIETSEKITEVCQLMYMYIIGQ